MMGKTPSGGEGDRMKRVEGITEPMGMSLVKSVDASIRKLNAGVREQSERLKSTDKAFIRIVHLGHRLQTHFIKFMGCLLYFIPF